MKENVLEVLMYLFETYIDAEEEPEPDQNELRDELSRAGFGDSEIDRALDWLDGLADNHEGHPRQIRVVGLANGKRVDIVPTGREHTGNVSQHAGHVLHHGRQDVTHYVNSPLRI